MCYRRHVPNETGSEDEEVGRPFGCPTLRPMTHASTVVDEFLLGIDFFARGPMT
jgi:hypothetical protein